MKGALRLRTEQLEYIAAVARLGSFRRAAEELHISQPALSATVRKLERELGVDDPGARTLRRSGQSDEGRGCCRTSSAPSTPSTACASAADEQHQISRMVRLGTVNAGTVPLLTAAAARVPPNAPDHPGRSGRRTGGGTSTAPCAKAASTSGSSPAWPGDDMPPELETTGCCAAVPSSACGPTARLPIWTAVTVAELLSQPLILMRSGYLMHRYVHRLLEAQAPTVSYSTDGAEMGKLMVAEGLGRHAAPGLQRDRRSTRARRRHHLAAAGDDDTEVRLALRRRRSGSHPRAGRDLHRIFVERAHVYEAAAT